MSGEPLNPNSEVGAGNEIQIEQAMRGSGGSWINFGEVGIFHSRSLSDLRVRIKINAPECPLSRFYSDLGLLPWSKTGDFGEKRAKPDSLLVSAQ
jgi:hypothetical protein